MKNEFIRENTDKNGDKWYHQIVVETLEGQNECLYSKLKIQEEKIKRAIECINRYSIELEDYSKIYNDEEKELLNILRGEDNE